MTKRGYVSLGEIAARLEFLRIECDRCGRKGRYNTARRVATYGADASIEPLQNYGARDCPKRRDPTIELGAGCAPLCPELSKLWACIGSQARPAKGYAYV